MSEQPGYDARLDTSWLNEYVGMVSDVRGRPSPSDRTQVRDVYVDDEGKVTKTSLKIFRYGKGSAIIEVIPEVAGNFVVRSVIKDKDGIYDLGSEKPICGRFSERPFEEIDQCRSEAERLEEADDDVIELFE